MSNRRKNWLFGFKEYKNAILFNAFINVVLVGSFLLFDELRYSDNHYYFVLVIFIVNGISNYMAFLNACENEKKKEKIQEMEVYKEKITRSLNTSDIECS